MDQGNSFLFTHIHLEQQTNFRRELAESVLELYNLRPSENIYSLFTPDVEFQDPLAKVENLGELKSQVHHSNIDLGQFNSLRYLFYSCQVVENQINPFYTDNCVSVDMKVKYVPRVIHAGFTMDSLLIITLRG